MISFTYNTNKIQLTAETILNTGYCWLDGNVCLYDSASVIILENVPVVEFLYELYVKLKNIIDSNIAFMLVSNDLNYNMFLFRRNFGVEIESDWGFSIGTYKIDNQTHFEKELILMIKNSYAINCMIIPETKTMIIQEGLRKLVEL